MLTDSAVHAVRAMIALGSLPKSEFHGAGRLAGYTATPPDYLVKVLRTLARAGLVVSKRGARGGWALAREASSVSLADVVASVEGGHRWRGCLLCHDEIVPDRPCHVHHAWSPIRDQYLEFLERTSLKELVDRGGLERLESLLELRGSERSVRNARTDT